MLKGRRIAVPESRQLDVLARLLEARGGSVLRVPLVSIHDAPDPTPVLAWLRRFVEAPPDLLILLTGEGLRRLLALAERHRLREDFIAALGRTEKLCRGPKPERVLGEIGLKGDIQALAPTTDGIVETLESAELDGKRVAVQLYGEEPNLKLIDYLRDRGAAPDAVAPYVYADHSEEERVASLIQAMQAAELDAIAFTSQPQYARLREVARKRGLEAALREGLARCTVAAVGPLVRAQLEEAGVKVDVMPERTYFMKPLVTAIMRHFEAEKPAG